MKMEKFTQEKKYVSELWRHHVIMKNGWRVGLMITSALLLFMGCTPLC